MVTAFSEMLKRHAAIGRVAWIGTRAARKGAITSLPEVEIGPSGLAGDHAKEGKRAVTLIQAEHLPIIASFAGLETIMPDLLRRNIMVTGINLAAMRKAQVRVGGAILQITGPCPPCSRMETVLGYGGYNAMRGHGGWYAEVISAGHVRLDDDVSLYAAE